MLTRLRIENYALVDSIDIAFKPGLTVLTGETGAGKSVIIGGLILTLGGRADKELIRHGTQKSTAQSFFSVEKSSPASKSLKALQVIDKETSLQLTREVSISGSSRCFVNDSASTLPQVKDIAALLCDLNTQQGQRNLLDVQKHILFLDNFAGLIPKVTDLNDLYQAYSSLEKQLADAQSNADSLRERLELMRFQIDELTKADIRDGEEADLDTERKRLESVRTLMETGQEIVVALSESDNSILSTLSQLDNKLRHSADIDKQLADDAAMLSESVINLNELTRNIESYLSRLEDNPARLDEINERLAELYRLRKKYRTDEAGLVQKLADLIAQAGDTTDVTTIIKRLTEQVKKARDDYFKLASEISTERKKAAFTLEKKLVAELADLAIEKAAFKIDFQTEGDDSGFSVNGEMVRAFPHGLENIEFLISTNPNEPLRPLVKIASGGEISRIMLALMTVIADKYRFPTIIFDEIDTGIGGATAIKLAKKLKQLAKSHQIITISHLAAVASQADNHLCVTKRGQNKRNVIVVEELSGKAIQKELDRMTAIGV